MTSLRQSTVLVLASLFLTSWLSLVQADIQCASPQTGTFKAGDQLILDWNATASGPKVSDIISMSAVLYCDTGLAVANKTVTTWAAPDTWVVPNVGNATTAGGTVGTCPSNSFHVEYSGQTTETIVLIPITKSFKVSCGSITILPAPNVTTTTTTIAPTSTTTTTKSKTATTASSSTASPTNSDNSNEDSKPKTFVIVIVAIVAALIVFLLAFATWWYLRKQRIQRMKDAVMPWSTEPNNQFTKVPSIDEGRSGSINGAAAGAPYGVNKPQPGLPQPQKSYYPEEDYGYNQHGGYGGYGNNQDYNGQDDYYNPSYAANMHGYGSPPTSNAGYYNGKVSYGEPRDQYQQQQGGFYPPPPPPIGSSPQFSSPVPSSVSQLNTLPEQTPALSSGSLRAPQAIVPEKENEAGQSIPMGDLSKGSS